MSTCPLFTVIIPLYNCEKYISRAIKSVIEQTYSNWELIVVDDCSTDDSRKIVRKFTQFDRRIRLIKSNENFGGPARPRNIGIKNAKGVFIAFLDNDDVWYSDKLSLTNKHFQDNSNIDFICHDETIVQNGIKKGELIYGPHKTFEKLLFKGNCISTSATVIKRKKIFAAGLFSENISFNGVEDYEFWMRLSKICHIEYLHMNLGEFHVHGASITSNISKHLENTLNVIDYYYNLWPHKNLYYCYLFNKIRSNALRSAGREFIKNEKRKIGRKYLIKALTTSPLSIKNVISIIFYIFNIKK